MENQTLAQIVSAFIERPDSEKATQIISECRPFICKQAWLWQNPQMSIFERIREIMAEMFLILLEDFRPEQVRDSYSVLSYLQLKLRRLTRPWREKSFAFGLTGDMQDLGRYRFSPFRLQLTDEIVAAVRKTLASQKENQAGVLEFLFIHIFPEIAWASRSVAQRLGEDANARHEADRKRHRSFNSKLRGEFNQLESGDWREVADWSSGERSYLANRIIDFVPADFSCPLEPELQTLAQWRNSFNKSDIANLEEMNAASLVFRALQTNWSRKEQEFHMAEEPAVYGEDQDILALLICPACKTTMIAAEAGASYAVDSEKKVNAETDTNTNAQAPDFSTFDKEFSQAAAEIAPWLNSLLKSSTFSQRRI